MERNILFEAIRAKSTLSEIEERSLKEIEISTQVIFAYQRSIEASSDHYTAPLKFGLLKATVIELHNIYTILPKAKIKQSFINTHYDQSALIEVRNAICHIKERINYTKKIRGKPEQKLSWETQSTAGGLLKSTNGGNSWIATGHDNLDFFNLETNGLKGARTTVGYIDNYLVIQSQAGCISLEIRPEIFNRFYTDLVERVNKIDSQSN